MTPWPSGSQGPWEDRETAPTASSHVQSPPTKNQPLVPPTREAGDLPLHMAGQKEGLSLLTPWPQAESCTSGTLWRVFEALQEPPLPAPTIPAPSQDPCRTPPQGPGAVGSQGPPHTKSFPNS